MSASTVTLGSRPALIVIDMQNGFCAAEGFMNQIGLGYEASAAVVEPIAIMIGLYFSIYGFLAGYLLTRTFIEQALEDAARDAADAEDTNPAGKPASDGGGAGRCASISVVSACSTTTPRLSTA